MERGTEASQSSQGPAGDSPACGPPGHPARHRGLLERHVWNLNPGHFTRKWVPVSGTPQSSVRGSALLLPWSQLGPPARFCQKSEGPLQMLLSPQHLFTSGGHQSKLGALTGGCLATVDSDCFLGSTCAVMLLSHLRLAPSVLRNAELHEVAFRRPNWDPSEEGEEQGGGRGGRHPHLKTSSPQPAMAVKIRGGRSLEGLMA